MAHQPTEAQWNLLRQREAHLLDIMATGATPHDIEIDGVTMHYLEAGSPTLPTLVMLHGRGSAAALFFPVIPLLSQHRHIIAIDMRGWGLSSRAPFTGTTGADAINWWRDGVIGIIDALGIQRFELLGHSLGGMVSLAVALERQAQIDHLLLEDAGGFGAATPFASRLYFAVSPERLARLVPRPIFNWASGGSVPVEHASAAHKQALQDFLFTLTTFPGTRESAIRAFDRIVGVWGAKYTLKDQVFKIQTPTRALWGTKDSVVLLSKSEPAIKTMPHAEIMTFPGAAHSPHFEQPQPFAQAVLDFLARGAEAPVG